MELDRCPFCDSTEVRVDYTGYDYVVYHFVSCYSCYARGPQKATQIDAIEAWNKAIKPSADPHR